MKVPFSNTPSVQTPVPEPLFIQPPGSLAKLTPSATAFSYQTFTVVRKDDSSLEGHFFIPKKLITSHPIVIIGGAGNSAGCFGLFAAQLAERGIPVVAFSPLGLGKSSRLSKFKFKTRTLRGHAEDTMAVIHHIKRQFKGLGSPIVLGYSFGARVMGHAVKLGLGAVDSPVAAFIHLNGCPLGGTAGAAFRVQAMAPSRFIRANAKWSFLPIYGSPEIYRKAMFSPQRSLAEIEQYMQHTDDYYYGAFIQALKPDKGLAHSERSLRTPIMIYESEHDAIYPPHRQRLYGIHRQSQDTKLLGVAHSTVIEGAHHAVVYELASSKLVDTMVRDLTAAGLTIK